MSQQARRNRKTGRTTGGGFGTNFVTLSGIMPAGSGLSGIFGPSGFTGSVGLSGQTGHAGVSGFSGYTGTTWPSNSFPVEKVMPDKYLQFRVRGKLVFLCLRGDSRIKLISHHCFYGFGWTFIDTANADYRFFGTSKEEHEEIIAKFQDAFYGQEFIDKL